MLPKFGFSIWKLFATCKEGCKECKKSDSTNNKTPAVTWSYESLIHTKISNRHKDICFIIKGRLTAYVTSVIDNNKFECETVKLDKLDSFLMFHLKQQLYIYIYFISRKQVCTKRILTREDLVKMCMFAF